MEAPKVRRWVRDCPNGTSIYEVYSVEEDGKLVFIGEQTEKGMLFCQINDLVRVINSTTLTQEKRDRATRFMVSILKPVLHLILQRV